jgi:hypothetical protein
MKKDRFRAALVFSDRGLETLSTIRGDHALGTRLILEQGQRIKHFADELGRRARELARGVPVPVLGSDADTD